MRSTVLVVDDHDGFRTEARAVLEGDGFVVVGEAATAAEALAAAAELRPGVVVLDVGLPDESGLDVVGRIRDRSPDAVIVLVSGRRARDYGGRVALSGADAFIEKASLGPGALASLLDRVRPR
jgi:DNA-binding NarL/FixJ family response regulator